MIGLETRDGLSPAVEQVLEDFDATREAPMERRERRVETGMAIAFAAIAAAMAVTLPWTPAVSLPVAVALVVCYAVVSRIEFVVGGGYTVPTMLVFVPLLFLLPAPAVPAAVAAGIALGHLPDCVRGRKRADRFLPVFGDAVHAIGPACVFAIAGITGVDWSDWPVWLAALGAQFLSDAVTGPLRVALAHGGGVDLQIRLQGWVYLVDLLLAPIGLLAAIAAEPHPLTVLLVLPLAGLLGVFATERRQRIDHALELSRAYRGVALLLSDVLEEDDEYTGMHSRDVVSLSVSVAHEMGLDDRRRRNVEFGALLHDIGKIAVPNEIINKNGPLNDEEWVIIKAHTVEGQRMLDRVGGVLREVGQVVRSSHERWDGGGYPDGLAGGAIPLESTIVSCCDAFNAMTTDRSYRKAMPIEVAVAEVQRCAGTQFNPAVVRALLDVVGRTHPFAATQALAPVAE